MNIRPIKCEKCGKKLSLFEGNICLECEEKAIQALVQEPKMGHWITRPYIYGVVFCSECGFELKIDDTKFCPNCGARMESEEV